MMPFFFYFLYFVVYYIYCTPTRSVAYSLIKFFEPGDVHRWGIFQVGGCGLGDLNKILCCES